uniref:Uncharacterized protein n=1 Tax=Aegilops tauschii subsp. strangulata TaxID=200361 RepID=A0A453L8T1_AEGTS
CSDVWFRYSPPPRNPTPKKKQARRRRPEGDVSRERARASSDAATAKSGASRYQVRHVDEDLYKAPPPEPASHRRPRKVRTAPGKECLVTAGIGFFNFCRDCWSWPLFVWPAEVEHVDGMPGPQLMRRLLNPDGMLRPAFVFITSVHLPFLLDIQYCYTSVHFSLRVFCAYVLACGKMVTNSSKTS